MTSDQPPSYIDSTIFTPNVQSHDIIYDVGLYNNHIIAHMKPEYVRQYREQSRKVLSYEGNVKKQEDQTTEEYTEFLIIIRQRINDAKYKIYNMTLDNCTIQIIIESYFKLNILLNCFVPTEDTSVQSVQQPIQQDLIFLAYLPPLHISLTKLCIDNIRLVLIQKGTSHNHLPLNNFNQLEKASYVTNAFAINYLNKSMYDSYGIVKNTITIDDNSKTRINYAYIRDAQLTGMHRKGSNCLQMISPTEIGLSYFNDSTFSFISHLVNLTDLVIYDENVAYINLSKNRKLKTLTVCAPKLTDLNTVKYLPNLEFIDVCETAIIDNSIFTTLPKLKKIVLPYISKCSQELACIDGLAKNGVQILSYNNLTGWF